MLPPELQLSATACRSEGKDGEHELVPISLVSRGFNGRCAAVSWRKSKVLWRCLRHLNVEGRLLNASLLAIGPNAVRGQKRTGQKLW